VKKGIALCHLFHSLLALTPFGVSLSFVSLSDKNWERNNNYKKTFMFYMYSSDQQKLIEYHGKKISLLCSYSG
jgi:hypothetical protein